MGNLSEGITEPSAAINPEHREFTVQIEDGD
jgi:hypothetical protein